MKKFSTGASRLNLNVGGPSPRLSNRISFWIKPQHDLHPWNQALEGFVVQKFPQGGLSPCRRVEQLQLADWSASGCWPSNRFSVGVFQIETHDGETLLSLLVLMCVCVCVCVNFLEGPWWEGVVQWNILCFFLGGICAIILVNQRGIFPYLHRELPLWFVLGFWVLVRHLKTLDCNPEQMEVTRLEPLTRTMHNIVNVFTIQWKPLMAYQPLQRSQSLGQNHFTQDAKCRLCIKVISYTTAGVLTSSDFTPTNHQMTVIGMFFFLCTHHIERKK